MKKYLFVNIVLCLLLASCSKSSDNAGDPTEDVGQNDGHEGKEFSAYDKVVIGDKPVGYWLLHSNALNDASGKKHDGTWNGEVTKHVYLPNNERAIYFNGQDAYYEIPDADHLEVTTKGVLTIEAWMCPGVLDFAKVEEGKDYIHWMGKGVANQHSWAARMYNKDSFRENRPQRISGYAFNLEGGLGAGSYFQEPIAVGKWVHYVLIINTNNKSAQYPTGYTKIYKDGVMKDQDALSGYDIIPGNGTAPIRIGTRDFNSFFEGGLAKIAIYDYELSAQQIRAHFAAMK